MNQGVERDSRLVLRSPQHFHVEVFAYASITDTGNFVRSTRFELVGNDLTLTKSYALALAEEDQDKIFVREVRQCADKTHLESMD